MKRITGLGLKESKDLVDSADGTTPIFVKTLTAVEAHAAKEDLETAGATVQMEGNGMSTRVFRNGVDVTSQGLLNNDCLCYEVNAAALANTTWVILAEDEQDKFDVNGDGVVNPLDAATIIEKYTDK